MKRRGGFLTPVVMLMSWLVVIGLLALLVFAAGCVQQANSVTPVVQPVVADADQQAAREFFRLYRSGLAAAAAEMVQDHQAKKFPDVDAVDKAWGQRAKAAHLKAQQVLIDRIEQLKTEDPNDPRTAAVWAQFAKEWGRDGG